MTEPEPVRTKPRYGTGLRWSDLAKEIHAEPWKPTITCSCRRCRGFVPVLRDTNSKLLQVSPTLGATVAAGPAVPLKWDADPDAWDDFARSAPISPSGDFHEPPRSGWLRRLLERWFG